LTDTTTSAGRAPRCHFDRTLDDRVLREHREDCTSPDTHRGCAPCTAPHCGICDREHLDNTHPATCPDCLGKVRDDLTDIQADCRQRGVRPPRSSPQVTASWLTSNAAAIMPRPRPRMASSTRPSRTLECRVAQTRACSRGRRNSRANRLRCRGIFPTSRRRCFPPSETPMTQSFRPWTGHAAPASTDAPESAHKYRTNMGLTPLENTH
jgi:hypothetical protein